MSLKTVMEADLAAVFSTDDFGEVATIGGASVSGHFDDGLDDETDPRSPIFMCAETDAAGLDHGESVTIDGQDYWLEGWRPDGHGIVSLVLRRSLYSMHTASFDGTASYMDRQAAFTGIADGKTGTVAFWFKVTAFFSSGLDYILDFDNRVSIYFGTAETLKITAKNPANGAVFSIESSTANTVDGLWHHYVVSWDLATASSHLYRDDVEDMGTVFTIENDTIDYTGTPYYIGRWSSSGIYNYDGCLAEFYFNPAEYVDLSVTANRRKFIAANTARVYLGADGSTPTGTAPIIWLPNGYDDFATNEGTGGDFAVSGTLADCGAMT